MDASVALANGRDDSATELWRHPNVPATQMWAFLQRINDKYALQLQAYGELYRWSTNNIALFWEEVWHFTGVRAVKEFDLVRDFRTLSTLLPSSLLSLKFYHAASYSGNGADVLVTSFVT